MQCQFIHFFQFEYDFHKIQYAKIPNEISLMIRKSNLNFL